MKNLRFLVDADRIDAVELEFKRLKGTLLALNTMFEAARIGRSSGLTSGWAGDIEDLLEAAGDAVVQD
jgi:hypothetical protein